MQTGKYLAGYAKLDITPFVGCRIIDLGKDVVGTGVLDPLYVRAIAFSDGEKKSVMMVLDNWISVPDYLGWIPRLAKELDMDEESINYFATHSHPTPCISENEEYDAFVYHRMKDAITIALDDLKPVTDVMWVEGLAKHLPSRQLASVALQTAAKVTSPQQKPIKTAAMSPIIPPLPLAWQN